MVVCVCFCWKNIRRRLEHVRPPHLFSTLERIGEFSSSVSSSSLFPSPLPRAGPLFDCSARYGWTLLLLPEAKGGRGVVVCTVYAGGLLKERPHLHFSHAERIGGTKWQQFISGEISTVNSNMLSRVAKEQSSYLCYFARLIFSKSESKR